MSDDLSILALGYETSVYELFHWAASPWGFSKDFIEQRFADYLKYQTVPKFVSCYASSLITPRMRDYYYLIYGKI
jgi:hypothetical protein